MRWLVLTLASALATLQAQEIRGAALVSHPHPALLTWGENLTSWDLASLRPTILRRAIALGSAGCVADVDGDGRDDLLAEQSGRFVWLRAPRFEVARVIETDTGFHDCLPFTLAGHRGVLLPHLDAQLRFYDFQRFESKELYSIYTNSRQGGMLAHDVDGDGLPDLFLGNYWVRNPGRLDVAWRLFAVNTFHDTPTAALARFALWPGGARSGLIWAESESPHARLVHFERPADVKQLWIEHRLEPAPDHPKALLVLDGALYVGHADGVTRYRPEGANWLGELLDTRGPVLALYNVKGRVLAVKTDGVYYLLRR